MAVHRPFGRKDLIGTDSKKDTGMMNIIMPVQGSVFCQRPAITQCKMPPTLPATFFAEWIENPLPPSQLIQLFLYGKRDGPSYFTSEILMIIPGDEFGLQRLILFHGPHKV